MRSVTEVPKQYMNIGKVVRLLDQEKERDRETTGDSVMKISREDVQHDATKTEEDSPYPRVTRQMSEMRNEKENENEVWRASGIVIESPIGSALEESSKIATVDILEGEEDTQMQYGHKTPEVKRSIASGPPKEPLPWRLVNRLNEWKKIGGDTPVIRGTKALWRSPQSPISYEERKHRQEFRWTTEMMNNYLSLLEEELKDGVVKSVQESEEKWFNPTFIFLKKWKVKIVIHLNSPDLEEFGMDSFRREIELVIDKERGVSGMVVELREDGSDAPREEESASPGGCTNVDNTGKEEKETEDERPGSTPREVEFCEVTTPTSEFVDEAYAIRAEAGYSQRGLEKNGNSQPNVVRRVDTLEEDPAREQTEVSEEKEQTSRANNGCVRAGMGCSFNNTNREQRGEDICPRELDPPGECVSDKREGVQSSVEDTREKGSMTERTEDRPYSFEDRQYVHEMDDSLEKGSAIAHSNTEGIGEEIEQPGHLNTDGTSPGRTEYRSRCT
ncbi:uncharacterized protein MONOS_9342 [Monocercomonoides exilis]|uniref:uncharacterized protein n=1 Tax=Monocercomonoides exilis TaxID=2049356 RepID=UPI00355957C7|nr:hypothetical protein MONOS_9342 [Monocercomonoides exilis]|eukprot:MONOS_9342.1-p1 / transcript=MONOS_9342.1 / gene=MONOS_9342 / organism=Monocercomonoides_exilis_PA203 / gene_product=unspecified product / transcript_product=unspecified product / location=Mono_scaffold00382:29688-31248(-) / protein_length=502 / sequence_SO=supercontig / SO=protein_coding / is_pseudo=false